jgi:hypothetical protein
MTVRRDGFRAELRRWPGWPAVAADADGEMQVFVMGTDGALWQLSQSAPGGDWSWTSHGA